MKDAAAAQRLKDKTKRKSSFFGFGGSSKEVAEGERDTEQDYDDQEEVRVLLILWL